MTPGSRLDSTKFPNPQLHPNGWRDDGCGDRDHTTADPYTYEGLAFDLKQGATQWDWMTFLRAVRHDPNNALSMAEYNELVIDACDGDTDTCEFVWDGTNASGFSDNQGFLPAAEAKYGNDTAKYLMIALDSDAHGVNEEDL